MTGTGASTVGRGAARLSSDRRGVIEWRLPLPLGDDAEVCDLVGRFFAVSQVRSVRLDRGSGRLRVDYGFRADRHVVLGAVRSALRERAPTGCPSVSPGAVNCPVVALRRVGGVVSSWRVRSRAGGVVECFHEALAASPSASFAIEAALALVPGVRAFGIDRGRGMVKVRSEPGRFQAETLLAALEGAIAADRPTADFLPPTKRGYQLDAVQIVVAAAAPVAPAVFFPVSALLLVGCYSVQLRDAVRAARRGGCDWNTVVAAVVALTIWNAAYLPAALMSLALRGWRSLEHWRMVGMLVETRRRGLTPRRARLLARAAFQRDDSGRRAVALANASALPVLALGVVGIVVGGGSAALGAVRPDFLTVPRSGNRIEALRFLARCALRGISLARFSVADDLLHASDVAIFSGDVPCGRGRLRVHGVSDAVSLERVVGGAAGRVVYFGPALDWSAACRERIVWCLEDCEHDDADVCWEGRVGDAMRLLLREAAGLRARRVWLEKLPLVGNGALSVVGAFGIAPPWSIAAATNAITAAVWSGLRGGVVKPLP